jgi:hypothetical protein
MLCGFAIQQNRGAAIQPAPKNILVGFPMTEKTTDRLSKLKQRKAQLEAQIAAAESKAQVAARKLDTRRKIIVGGSILAAIEDSPGLREMVRAVLAQRVTRPNDRAAVVDLLADAPASTEKTPGASG